MTRAIALIFLLAACSDSREVLDELPNSSLAGAPRADVSESRMDAPVARAVTIGEDGPRLDACGGMGQVATNQGFLSIRRTCPKCSGSGVAVENPCGDCSGEGRLREPATVKVNVPPGVDDGTRLCSRGRGDAGLMGGSSGDLYVFVQVKEHKIFERDGDDLFHELSTPFTLAALGGSMDVPTLNGKVSLKIPAGTQSGRTFRLRDKGMPNLRNSNRVGDLYARISIHIPEKLTKKQREALVEFAKTCGEKDVQTEEGIIDKAKRFFENED